MTEQAQPSRQTSRIVLFLASNAGLGYAPVMPGTFGTLAGIPVFFYISRLSLPLQFIFISLLVFLSFWICDLAGRLYGEVDDKRIVIDELAGYLITTAFLPFTWTTAIIGFIWFRIFDITKPSPAGWFDRNIKNGLGVTLDDVIAGVYAMILLRVGLALFS